MNSRQNSAREWVRSVASSHLPRTARSFRVAVYTGEANVNSTLGLQIDLAPFEGKVVELTDEWILIKASRGAEFFVAARDIVDTVPELGATVRITPYARRGFDGRRLDAPTTEVAGNGVVMKTYKLGESRSVLPIDKDALRCEELKNLVGYIEAFDAKDGVRCLSQVLVDAGAFMEPVAYVDPLPADIIDTPPSLKFRVKTAKVDGWLAYCYDRGMDTFNMYLTDLDGGAVKSADTVYFDQLAGITVDWIDDGTWRIATVEVLKPAPRRAAAA